MYRALVKNFFICLFLLGGLAASISCGSSKKTATNSETTTTSDRDGSSFGKAIVVKSIREEYAWVGEHYPGSKFEQQSLRFQGKNPYDVLTFKLSDGSKKDFYFDISKFFGKF